MRKFLPIFLIAGVFSLTFLLKDEVNVLVKRREFAHSPANGELLTQSYIDRILLSDGAVEENISEAVWFNKRVTVPSDQLVMAFSNPVTNILGESSEEKWIEINLTEQKLYAHEGDRTVYAFPISSGLPWMPTVTGEFRVWAKVTSQRMRGGSVADGTYYDLPNVPFVQYFYKGYGLHGAYWHNDFGRPRSHGCVNMRIEDAKTLFFWTSPLLSENQKVLYKIDPGQSTRVVVHGSTPAKLN